MDCVYLLQLMISLLCSNRVISYVPISCNTALDDVGNCRTLTQWTESKCYNNNDNYQSMRALCSPTANTNTCCHRRCCSSSDCDCPTLSDGRWTSQSCSIPSTTLLQPLGYNLTLLPSPIDYNTFSLTIHWNEIENVSGYAVIIRDDIQMLIKYSTNDSKNTDLILPTLCYDSVYSTLTIELERIDDGMSELVDYATIKRENCYTLYNDNHRLQRTHCGPNISDEVRVSEVKICSIKSDDDELSSVRVSWPKIPNVYTYEMRITNHTGYKTLYNATNTNEVILSGFNQSLNYKIRIRPYIECAGMYLEIASWQPCTGDPFPLSLSTTCQANLSPWSHDTVDMIAATLSPTTTQHIIISSTTLLITSSSSVIPSSSSSHTSPYSAPLVACMSVLLAILILTAVIVMISCVVWHKSSKKPLSPSQSEMSSPPSSPSPLINPSLLDGYIHPLALPQSQSPAVVWVLYSLETPDEQQYQINCLLLAGLANYNISTETPGSINNRRITRDWLERGVNEADAVLLICNDQFYNEWLSEGSGGGVKMGHEVKMLKNGVKSSDLSKFAYVHFEETDSDFQIRYCQMLSPFIQKWFSLAGDREAVAVQSIADFVWNTPKYKL